MQLEKERVSKSNLIMPMNGPIFCE